MHGGLLTVSSMFGSGKGKEPMPASAQEDLGLAAEAQRVGESQTRSLFPVHVSDQRLVVYQVFQRVC
jgi:hypothetical protein